MRPRLRPAALAALIPLILLGCGLLRFEVEQEDESTIEGAGLLGEVLGALDFTGLDDFQTSIDGELADQGVEQGDLKHVQLIAFELQAEPDLAFVERLDVYVSADGVDEVRVASGEGFEPGQTEIALQLDGAELVEHVVAGGLRFRAEATGSAPVDDTALTTRVVVAVEATAQGACNQAR